MADSTIFFIVLAGGTGDRLWPLSNNVCPKQLIPFLGGKTLLQQTVDRIQSISVQKQLWVVTTQQYEHVVKKVLCYEYDHLVLEPCKRNTAPAIILSLLHIQKQNPHAVVVFLTADHYIPDEKKWAAFVHHAIECAKQYARIILLGIKPTHPATGYGYIAYEQGDLLPAAVKKFFEKPNKKTAQEYIKKGMLWNSGIFVARGSVFLQEIKNCAPDVYNKVDAYYRNKGSYGTVPNISIDHAVMEKSRHISVLPVDFVWQDVGTLETFIALQEKNKQSKKIIELDSKNNIVFQDGSLVVLIGVENLCVVQKGNIIVVSDRLQVERVKQASAKVYKQYGEQYE